MSAEMTFQGLSNERSSSRVLKPPGGGHSDIFGAADAPAIHTRPKYDQQNSSNISGALGTSDANQIAKAAATEMEPKPAPAANGAGEKTVGESVAPKSDESKPAAVDSAQQQHGRGRVPPGGYSAGFW